MTFVRLLLNMPLFLPRGPGHFGRVNTPVIQKIWPALTNPPPMGSDGLLMCFMDLPLKKNFPTPCPILFLSPRGNGLPPNPTPF